MKSIQNILIKNQIKRGILLKIKGGNDSSSNILDEDAIDNQLRPRTGMFGG